MKLAPQTESHLDAFAASWVEPPPVDARLQSCALDIANRLRFVCGHLEPDELIELATRIASVELKYETGELAPERRRRIA